MIPQYAHTGNLYHETFGVIDAINVIGSPDFVRLIQTEIGITNISLCRGTYHYENEDQPLPDEDLLQIDDSFCLTVRVYDGKTVNTRHELLIASRESALKLYQRAVEEALQRVAAYTRELPIEREET